MTRMTMEYVDAEGKRHTVTHDRRKPALWLRVWWWLKGHRAWQYWSRFEVK